jgi:lysine 6-dehydrogenase
MKILILGSGLMGPAAAFNAIADPDISQVVLCDASQQQLEAGLQKLVGNPNAQKLGIVRLDLNNQTAAAELIGRFDAVISALPPPVSPLGLRAAIQAGTPLVDLSHADEGLIPELEQTTDVSKARIILGGGLEPGLTEIMARYLAEKLDTVNELHIKCGGIPVKPTPPLGYKIVFGGREMPLHDEDSHIIENGQLKQVPRYSMVENLTFDGVGQVEAWAENFMPWLLNLDCLQGLQTGSQKTVRWPGYAAKITVLKEMGLLSEKPVAVDGVEVVPKKLLDTLLYPRVKLTEGEHDLTLFRVDVSGAAAGQPVHYCAQMVDRYDDATGFTSMARTTAFTGAIIARMMTRGELQPLGLVTPEQLISGPHFERLITELAEQNIRFKISRNET